MRFRTHAFGKRNILSTITRPKLNIRRKGRSVRLKSLICASDLLGITYVIVRLRVVESSSFGSPFASLFESPQSQCNVGTQVWKKAEMSSRKKQRLTVRTEEDFAIVALDDMEIWDGADLALIREALTNLIEQDGFRAIGVDLSAVKYIPSGFFGMLFEWYEQGLRVRLYYPQQNVEQMLWFRMFFTGDDAGAYKLSDDEMRGNSPNEQVAYHRREFMADDESIDDDEVEIHTKSVRFGVRAQV